MSVPRTDHWARAPARELFNLPRPVWLLGAVSFFTDSATEMIYPLLPLFVTRVLGGTALSLGIIEGVADAANSLLKIASGHLSDRWRARRPLVLAGYTISSLVRPLTAAAMTWPHVLAVRFIDRMGKGIRGAPRDAMLAMLADPSIRGLVYGFHRAMDHAGAVAGPIMASLFLFFYPNQYRTLFALAIVPGIVVILLLTRVREPADRIDESPRGPQLTISGWRQLPDSFYRALLVILLFALGNASDAFLLLRLSELGVATVWIPLLWAAIHVVKSVSSVIGGRLSDRLGRRRLIASGWILYAFVYVAFAVATSPSVVITVFLLYGLYFGSTEGAERALVADLAPSALRGTAFGLYNASIGIGALLSSIAFGYVWTMINPPAAFALGAILAAAATVLLFLLVEEPRR